MTYFGRYFRYRLKKIFFPTLVFTFLVSILVMTIIGVSVRSADDDYRREHSYIKNIVKPGDGNQYENNTRYYNSSVEVLTLVIAFASVTVPIAETIGFKKTRTLDFLFPMPIKRKDAAVCHYLIGLLQYFTISFVPSVVAFLLILGAEAPFAAGYVFPMFLTLFGIGLMFYSVAIFLFSQGNSIVDGLVSLFGFPIALGCICEAVGEVLSDFNFLRKIYPVKIGDAVFRLTYIFDLGEVFGAPSNNFRRLVEGRSAADVQDDMWIVYIFWAVCAIASAIGFVYWFATYRAEKAGDISNSVFAYKFSIPAVVLSIFVMLGFEVGATYAFVYIAMVVAYFIYRRSFKLRAVDYLVISYPFIATVLYWVVDSIER